MAELTEAELQVVREESKRLADEIRRRSLLQGKPKHWQDIQKRVAQSEKDRIQAILKSKQKKTTLNAEVQSKPIDIPEATNDAWD